MNAPNHRGFARLVLFETKQQLWSLGVLVAILVLASYTTLQLLSAEKLAEIGAAGIPRNSPIVAYVFTAGNGFWLHLFLAYLMSAPIMRDIQFRLVEVRYAVPRSAWQLLLAQYLGALVTAHLVALAVPLSFLVFPAIAELQGLPPDAVGPTPYAQLAHAYLVLVSSTVFGLGTLYFAITAWTGRSRWAYAAAFGVMLLIMFGFIALYQGRVDRALGVLVDPIGFTAVHAQTDYWDHATRSQGFLLGTFGFVVNRALVLGVGSLALMLTLRFVTPEHLLGLIGTSRRRRGGDPSMKWLVGANAPATAIPHTRHESPWSTCMQLGVRTLRQQVVSGTFAVVFVLGLVMMCVGGYSHVLRTDQGRFIPWLGVVWLPLFESFYLPAALYLAVVSGRLARREREFGLFEIEGAVPSPTWVLVVSRYLALIGVAGALAAALWVGVSVLQIAIDATTWSPLRTAGLAAMTAFPAFVQLGTLSFVIYALVVDGRIAHFLVFIATFVCVMNHEVGVVDNAQLQFAIPALVRFSPLTGLAPWIAPSVWIALWFGGICGLAVLACIWLWPRGTETSVLARLRQTRTESPRHGRSRRVQAGFALGIALIVFIAGERLDRAFRVENPLESPAAERAERAAYELTYAHLRDEPAVRLEQAVVHLELAPLQHGGHVTTTLTVENPSAQPLSSIHLGWPQALSITSARVEGHVIAWGVRDEHLRHGRIDLEPALQPHASAQVVLEGSLAWPSFKNHGRPHPVGPQGVWLRGEDFLPRLGYDPHRELLEPGHRKGLGLPVRPDPSRNPPLSHGLSHDPVALSVEVSATPASALLVSGAPRGEGRVMGQQSGPLRLAVVVGDYAVTQAKYAPAGGKGIAIEVLHHPERSVVARRIADAAVATLETLVPTLGDFRYEVLRIVQVPNTFASGGLYGDVMLLPEPEAWNFDPGDALHDGPLFAVSRYLSEHWWIDGVLPRRVPGHALASGGLPVAAALEVLQQHRGSEVADLHVERLEDELLLLLSEAGPSDVPLESFDETYLPLQAGLAIRRVRAQLGQEVIDRRLRDFVANASPASFAIDALLSVFPTEERQVLLSAIYALGSERHP